MKQKKPLGYIDLEDNRKAIYATNDLFLNYTFKDEKNWEALRDIVNILVNAYKEMIPETAMKPIEGTIKVETQYMYYLNTRNATKDQDLKLSHIEESKLTYIEFQNRAITVPPIVNRAMEYFVLGIRQGKGKTADQIWLLSEDVETLLHGGTFTNYVIRGDACQ